MSQSIDLPVSNNFTDISLSDKKFNNFSLDDFKSFSDFQYAVNLTTPSNDQPQLHPNLIDSQDFSDLSSFENAKKYKCDQPKCTKSYSLIQHLNSHLLNQHKIDKRVLNVCCLECEDKFSKRTDLIKHLREKHDKNFEVKKISFDDFEEFDKFKIRIEKENNCSFVRNKGFSSKNKTFDCSRSGKKRLVDLEKRKRDFSETGSSKIDMCCTAFIKVIQVKTGQINVDYCDSHYGHSNDAKYLNLDGETIKHIIDLGRNEVDAKVIYKKIRSNFKGRKIQACNLITLNQIRYHLKKLSYDLSNNDLNNLKLMYEKEQKKDDDQKFIRFYKPRELADPEFPSIKEDQMLMVLMNQFQIDMAQNLNNQNERIVCMDATFGLNNKKVLLITLLMIDEYGEGVPLAYCLTEREDENSITAFLKIVKDTCGQITANDFLSDDASQYFSSWQTIFGNGAKKRLCSWHVYKNWKQQLRNKVSNKKKEDDIINRLISIRNSKDEETAKRNLDQLIKNLSTDKSTKAFASYLKSYYQKRIKEWIYCDRSVLIPNTNMHIEALHRLIKCIFLNSKRIQRISRCIEILKELTEQKELDRMVKIVKRKRTKKTKEIFNDHQKAVDTIENYELSRFYDDDESGDIIFEVISKVESNKDSKMMDKKVLKEEKLTKPSTYYVTQKKVPSDHSCERYCHFCIACSHQFECTCSKFIIKRQLCKHIHMIAIDFDVKLTNIEPESVKLPPVLKSIYKSDYEMCDLNDDKTVDHKNVKDQKDTLLEDCKFLAHNLVQYAEKLSESEDITDLFLFKDKLKSFCSKFETKIQSKSFPDDNFKKRKLDRQNRFI